MTLSEATPPVWHQLTANDAHFLGRLVATGIALPNAPHLTERAIMRYDPELPQLHHEVDRLVAAAEGIACIPGIVFGGLAHTQLELTEAMPHPLPIMIVPAEFPGVPTELTVKGTKFQCLIGASIVLPTDRNAHTILKKEGCFSSGPVGVIQERHAILQEVSAWQRDGEPIFAHDVRGPSAIVIQHEHGHAQGQRAADHPYRGIRKWVPRAEMANYREVPARVIDRWPHNCSAVQWQALSRDPDYNFFPTEALQEAFTAGQEAQQRLLGG